MLDVGWNRAVAAVTDAAGKVWGTAFFVGPDLAVTCDHVLVQLGDGPVRLRPVDSGRDEPVRDIDRSVEDDLALLRVDERADRTLLVFTADVGVKGDVTSHGFGENHSLIEYPEGFPMGAKARISGASTARYRDRDVPQLVIDEAGVTRGMSGAPVVDVGSGRVVGIFRFMKKGSNTALATPTAVAVARWKALLSNDAPPTFERTVAVSRPPESMTRAAWTVFRPNLLHCVVVESEGLAGRPLNEQLTRVMQRMLQDEDTMSGIWPAFLRARGGSALVGGGVRDLPPAFRNNVAVVAFTAQDAFTNNASLDLATRLLVEADLALFDVTGFEPGLMLLMGIRAATRRGVTIASHGAGWKEGESTRGGERGRFNLPFNLSDLALASHTPLEYGAGLDPRIPPLAKRIKEGFNQLKRQPFYRDLPVYDALRQLGSDREAWGTIPVKDGEVLVLCSYGEEYKPIWRDMLEPQLSTALIDMGQPTSVLRMLDIRTPQVVSQSLYERIRRCAGCVADWTHSSPSTFFELGVRLAVSPWDVVQIADGDWLGSTGLDQIELMRTLFSPVAYRATDDDLGRRVAEQLERRRRESSGTGGHRVRKVASAALGEVEDRLPDLPGQLGAEADALSAAEVDQDIPQALFFEVRSMKLDRERAALERRLAAWLYLEHRVDAARLDPADVRRVQWLQLGDAVSTELYARGEVPLADRISARIEAEEQP